MRKVLMVSMLGLLAGCQTTETTGKKSIAERRAEMDRYREEQARLEAEKRAAAEQEAKQHAEEQGTQPAAAGETASATGTSAAAGTQAPATTPATAAAGAAATTGPVGPREGLTGITASLLGGNFLLPGASFSPTLGLRYFTTDSVAFDALAGFVGRSQEGSDATLVLGARLNVYGGQAGTPMRPFFAGEAAFSHATSADASSDLSVAAGGGVEYWLYPQLSVSARLMLGFNYNLDADTWMLGTFTPGLGVTLYLP